MEYNQFSDIKSIFKNFFHKKEDFNNKELISKKENFSNKDAEIWGKRVGIFFATLFVYVIVGLLLGVLPHGLGFVRLVIFITLICAGNYLYYYYFNGEKEITDLLYEGKTAYIGGTLLILLIALASVYAAHRTLVSLTSEGKWALAISLILYAVVFIVVMILNLFDLEVWERRLVVGLVPLALVIIIFVFRSRIFSGLAKVAPAPEPDTSIRIKGSYAEAKAAGGLEAMRDDFLGQQEQKLPVQAQSQEPAPPLQKLPVQAQSQEPAPPLQKPPLQRGNNGRRDFLVQ